ncbi:hypothetical protein RB597_009490 [Gaeumannomyces tritici]
MSEEDHAAAVAEDYRDALDGLTMNSRVEISNLTLIARENTEAAHAIAEVLIDHIKQVVAPRKLPALYLLDSIVKNVGTPYTLFFGRKLYQTFMEAYASVDNGTRRKMDEMLKTWKEPVPGSLDTRPVFPPDTVRPIENALIKARTSALQAQQEQMRSQQQLLTGGRGRPPPNGPYRETPTPPGGPRNPYGHAFAPPPSGPNGRPSEPPLMQGFPAHHNPQGMPILSHQPPPSTPAALPYGPPAQDGVSIDALNNDITQLVSATRMDIARNPYDAVLQTKLKALLDLQVILQQGSLPRDQLVLVKNQVDELSVKNMAGSHAAHAPQQQQYPPAAAPDYARYSTHTPPVAAPVAPPASAPPAVPLSLDALLGKGALAALLAAGRQTATPQQGGAAAAAPPPPPPPQPGVTPALPAGLAAILRPPPPAVAPAGAPAPPAAADPMALMAMLRSSGLLPPTPVPAGPVGVAAVPVIAPTPVSLGMALPGVISTTGPVFNEALGDISLNSQSLKRPRLYLIATLHEDLGKPCTQCGRRFRNDAKGKAMKTAHMDWHFRVHQRLAEAEKKGHHRSFYVDEKDWVSSRETMDTDHTDAGGANGLQGGGGGGGGGGTAADEAGDGAAGDAGGNNNKKKAGGGGGRWIRVPDVGTTNTVCPICQEKFVMQWLEEAQDWVWTDAARVGPDRVFHASCHSEVTGGDAGGGGGGGGALGRHARGTPEPVLGKRKAEGDHRMRNKLKMDPGRINYDELPY